MTPLDLGGLHLIDSGFGDFGEAGVGGTTGVYLLPLEGGRFALIESGPGSTVARVRRGIVLGDRVTITIGPRSPS